MNLEGFIEVPGPDDELLECANRGTPAACSSFIARAMERCVRWTPYRNSGRPVASGYDLAADFGFGPAMHG